MKKIFLIAVILNLLAGSGQAKELKIGVIFGLTGEAAWWSQAMKRGLEMAAAESPEVKLIWEDSGSSPAKAVTAFRKLTEQDGVKIVIGDVFSFVTEPLIPLAEAKGVLLVTPALPESFCRGGDKFFTTASQIPRSRTAFERYFQLNSGVKKISLINFGDPGWGQAYRRIWEEIATDRGLEIVSTIENLEFSADLLSQIGVLLEKKPQAVLIAHNPLTTLKALRHYRYAGDIIFVNQLMEPFLDRNFGRAIAEGVYVVDTEATAEFNDRFRKRFETEPWLEAYTGYETLRAIIRSDGTSLKGVRYQGVSGQIDFSQSCSGNKAKWWLKQIRDGKPVKVTAP